MSRDLGEASIDVVRARRMAECWQDDGPSSAEIAFATARLRASLATRRHGARKVLLFALAQGFAFGIVSLAAAAFGINRLYLGPLALVPRPEARLGARSGATHRTSVLGERGLEVEGSPAAPHRAFGDAAKPPRLSRPTQNRENLETALSRGRTPGAGGKAAEGMLSGESMRALPPAPAPAPSGMVGPDVDGPWTRVAHALATSDWLRADQELTDLAMSPEAQTRDAANLARAELWLTHGRRDEARVTLTRLAGTARTPFVRKRAAELLESTP